MANTSTHPITVNGARLDTWAYNISVKDGWANTPDKRTPNLVVPGRNGELWTPGKRNGPAYMYLSMWVSHMDVDGNIPNADRYYNFRKNFDTLCALLDSTYSLLDVRQNIGNGEVRQAFCEVAKGLSPAFKGNLFGEFKVELKLPYPFWQDIATQDFSSPTGASAIAQHNVTTMAGSTAPIEDLIFQVKGPITNPRLTDVKSGHWIQLTNTIVTGSIWEVDCEKWTSVTGTATGFTGNGASVIQQTSSSGIMRPRLFALAPGNPPSVQLSGTGSGAGTQLVIRSRRKFL